MNVIELMDFVKSLNNRGLLSKTIDEFDYEWVIWDYERSKVKNFSSNSMLSDSSASPCEHRYSRTMNQPYPRLCLNCSEAMAAANALLISKAREMLEMLKMLINTNPIHEGYHELKLKAINLIKEATDI